MQDFRFVMCEAKNAIRALQINFSSFPEVKCSMLRINTHGHKLFNFQCNVGKICSKYRVVLNIETSCEENTKNGFHKSLV